MKNLIKICGAAMSALFLCLGVAGADSGHIVVDTYLPIPPAAAYSSTFSIRADGINWASAQIVVTSVTQASPAFNDGQASTATFTVVSFTALSTATATATPLTISSNTALVGACISGGGSSGLGNFNVCNPANFAVDVSFSSNTACNIAAAINSFNVILATCGTAGASVVSTTAPYAGSAWNSFIINSSTPAAISSATFTGGRDNQSLTINGKRLLANTDFFPITSTAQTATNIAAAISLNTLTIGATASATSNVVFATATTVGSNTNYAIVSSSQAALTMSPFTSSSVVTGIATGNMFGGFNSSYTINGSAINLVGNNLGLAEGVWFSTGSATGLTPLVWGTTYYAIPGTGSSVQLALTSTGAIAGLPIVFTSSAVKTTADTFTLNVPAITGTPSVTWAASNDNLHWLPYSSTPFNITIPSVSYASYLSTGTVTNFDFGHFDYSYIGLSVTAPTAGAINILAHIIGRD